MCLFHDCVSRYQIENWILQKEESPYRDTLTKWKISKPCKCDMFYKEKCKVLHLG